jgi:AcrR family transcriptional regulator
MNKRSGIESRKRILEAGMTVFSRDGYAKANIREIARNARISVGGFYLYFRNKEELYKSLIDEGRRDISSRLEIAAMQTESATEALSAFFALHLEYAVKHKEFILLHIREHGFSFDVREKKQFFRKQWALIESILQRGIRSGEFRKCNTGDMAKIIMGSLRGVVLSMALDDDVAITTKMLSEFMFHGLLTSGKQD